MKIIIEDGDITIIKELPETAKRFNFDMACELLGDMMYGDRDTKIKK